MGPASLAHYSMLSKHICLKGILFLVVLLIFYPVCFTDYVYTDEITQLWHYRPGSGFLMYGVQGRWIPELVLSRLYAAINTVHEITYIRIIALLAWFICIPVWYDVIKRIIAGNPGFLYLPFFTCLYLITSLPFAVSIQWATCMELSLGNTAGLLSGAVLYFKIRDNEKLLAVPVAAALVAAGWGQLSLFTYQSCFGCFLIPFLLHYISAYAINRELVVAKGLAFYLLMYAVYFVLFKLTLKLNHINNDPRADIHINLFNKLLFFLWQPLKRAFWFNVVVSNDNLSGVVAYIAVFLGWVLLAFVRFGKAKWIKALKYIIVVQGILLMAYLPSLVVKENYSSNRTLQAIDVCVFVVCAEMVLHFVKKTQLRQVAGLVMAITLTVLGWYNFNKQFLQPVHEEYVAVSSFIKQHYNQNIKTVYFIQPAEDAFRRKYHIQSSMDEFGMPLTFPAWVPEDLTRQMVYEKTGNRQVAAELTIKFWPNMHSFAASNVATTGNTLLVNVPVLIEGGK
jgi:hypothetical protein